MHTATRIPTGRGTGRIYATGRCRSIGQADSWFLPELATFQRTAARGAIELLAAAALAFLAMRRKNIKGSGVMYALYAASAVLGVKGAWDLSEASRQRGLARGTQRSAPLPDQPETLSDQLYPELPGDVIWQ